MVGAVKFDMNYDDGYQEIGYGSGFTELVQAYERRGIAFSSYLEGEADMQTFESFLDTTRGEVGGFWVSTYLRDVVLTGPAMTSAFRIVNQGYDNDWNLTPRAHLELRAPDGQVYQA